MSIRAARHDDVGDLREIELASGQRFREFDLPHIADDEPLARSCWTALSPKAGPGWHWQTTVTRSALSWSTMSTGWPTSNR